ncbi:DUF904 domain-containing protein [Piscinibacterium candidicorallinum]|jgi:Tfp pilus assembly protein PilO|uniref:DUF904 domain-containing protein n=1 Tax=Piscinibacterium candidicorallinum TaxID=1793872 RepID=A0ABV7GY54_9BURK
MQDELEAMITRVERMADALKTARAENQALRAELASKAAEAGSLQSRLSAARDRIAHLLERLPGETTE